MIPARTFGPTVRSSVKTSVFPILGALLALCLPSQIRAEKPVPKATQRIPLVAIGDMCSQGISAGDAAIISDNLATRLQQTGKVRVMERSQMQQILREQNFQASGPCDQGQCAVEMGRVLGIDQMVVGSVGLVGHTYSVNLRLIAVSTGEALHSSSRNQKGTIDQVLTELIPQAARQLTGESETDVASEGKPVWPWVVGGVVVAGGAATAAVLLLGQKDSPSAQTAAASPAEYKITW